MSTRRRDSPFTKWFKKTTDEIKEETRKTTEQLKKLGSNVSEADERTPLKLGAKKKTKEAAAITSPPPAKVVNGVTSSDDVEKSPTVKFATETADKKADVLPAASSNKSDEEATSSPPTVRFSPQTSNDINYASLESGEGGHANTVVYNGEKSSTSNNIQPSSSSAADTTTSSLFDIVSFRHTFIAIVCISTVYNTWAYRLDIALNEIPLIVAAHWVVIALFIGNSFKDGIALFQGESEESNVTSSTTKEEEMRRIPMGLLHYSKMKAARNLNSDDAFTNLKPAGERAKRPISHGMMEKLLDNPDYGRRKTMAIAMKGDCLKVQEELSNIVEEEDEEEEANYEMGTAPLINSRASKLERKFDYVVPMCKFRGMDFFVGDFPEKEIWKQPLLLK